MNNPISIYQGPDGSINLDVQVEKETIWLNEEQIAYLFDKERSVINKHINNIYKSQELEEKATCAKIAQVQKEGERKVKRQIKNYNLDMIISIGYRVDSIRATHFRQRATQTLRSHIIDGYTINQQRIQQNYQSFLNTVSDIQKLVNDTDLNPSDILELIKTFGQTRFSLDSYDKGNIPTTGYTQESIAIEASRLYDDITILKDELISQGQATDLFAQEKTKGSLEGILGSVFQSAFGVDAYSTIEEKAAHLLYFIIKNHPFNDDNKRTGAFSFIRFLSKVGYNFHPKITPEALTALTLLIAQSDPKDKKNITGLVILLLKQ